MVELIKKAFYTGIGLAVLTKDKAEEMIRDIAQQAKLSEHEGKELMDSLMKQSDQARQDFQAKLDEAVLAVVGRLHLATRDEIESLRARVEELAARVNQGGGGA